MAKHGGISLHSNKLKIFHFRSAKDKIHNAIASFFGIPVSKLYLTKPTFFSRMNTTEAKTIHDEYWHPHIDKVNYMSVLNFIDQIVISIETHQPYTHVLKLEWDNFTHRQFDNSALEWQDCLLIGHIHNIIFIFI